MVLSDKVLDEITELAAVEHAVIAEYLQIAYVLGHGLPDPAPGPAGYPRWPTPPGSLRRGAVRRDEAPEAGQ